MPLRRFLLLPLVVLVVGCDVFGPSLDSGRFAGDARVPDYVEGDTLERSVALSGTAQFRVTMGADGTVYETGVSLDDENGHGHVFFGTGYDLQSDGTVPLYDGAGTSPIGSGPGRFGSVYLPASGGIRLVPLEGALRITSYSEDEVAGTFEGAGRSEGWGLEFRARVSRIVSPG